MPIFETALSLLIAAAVFGYLLGSVPFGIVITRAFGLGDLRKIGSGNIGATNVLRTGNKPAAAATLILDAAKGGIAVLIVRAVIGPDAAQVAAFAAFLGHLYPVWLGFRGGKGVATFLGTFLALCWPVGLLCCGTWLVMAMLFRISSLAALVAAAMAPVWMVVIGEVHMIALAVLLAALVVLRHHTNIARLRAGTEPKIGAKR
ncbi:glycerol-3-phosphate 1-O-acyltransferase PlsY [Falsirhodobacter halotolerans]|uniref:glycerol-3-phosphate 1-O-acyltransferase PlsY n=1 Tax=Falsirhodobacter halotolerans TaxID=1146892 RepID=UPI001FD2136B|nr:glycerol-3-phosphate 1-O-acyltransferase PlsY [Falsirhodobacter halotolerans]MCJ8138810.1 glycerol-3-phosphate 1-O-acyltransferase PlsY [Falsirhodobacter halotolerans]